MIEQCDPLVCPRCAPGFALRAEDRVGPSIDPDVDRDATRALGVALCGFLVFFVCLLGGWLLIWSGL